MVTEYSVVVRLAAPGRYPSWFEDSSSRALEITVVAPSSSMTWKLPQMPKPPALMDVCRNSLPLLFGSPCPVEGPLQTYEVMTLEGTARLVGF